MKYLSMFILLFLLRTAAAQPKPAGDEDLRFMLDKLRMDYAGYQDKVDSPAFEKLVREVRASTSRDSFFTLSRLTAYWHDDHLAIFAAFKPTAADSTEAMANLEVIARTKPTAGPVTEGYWMDELGNQVIYLRRVADDRWEGDLVETKSKVPVGLRVLALYRQPDGWLADYVDAALGYRVIIPARLKGTGILVGNCYLKYRYCPAYHPNLLATKAPFSYEPSAERLDSQTLLMHMPYFINNFAKKYDSLIKANTAALQVVTTLILDIRNNPGGSIRCYGGLTPWICTGTMQRAGSSQLCSQDMIDDAKSTLTYYEKKQDSAHMAIYRKYIDSLLAHKDGFRLSGGGDSPCVAVPNAIKNVAILMDHGTRSAAELMVLYFRQSAKVRLFGEATAGAVDYLDLLDFALPQSKYEFWVASSKRVLTARDPAYDKGGIPPDVTIPDSEPDWIRYVQKYYGNSTDKP
jgi:Peptidase family S41